MRIPILTYLVCCAMLCANITLSAPLPTGTSGIKDDQTTLKPRRAAVKPDNGKKLSLGSDVDISRVIVKVEAGSRLRVKADKLISLGGKSMAQVQRTIREITNGQIRPLIAKAPHQIEKEKFFLEYKSGQQLADFNNYFIIETASNVIAEQLVNRLNQLPEVEIAYAEIQPTPAGDIDPPTPDFESTQTYLDPAPAGIDAEYSWTVPGGDGTGVTIADVEGGWRDDHEDLDAALGGLIGGTMFDDQDWRNHGTAVVGEMIGSDNGYGITGIAHGAELKMVAIGGIGIAQALLTAVDSLQAGDIMLIELHAPGPSYNFASREDQLGYICMEYWQANYDAIQLAWAKGIIVCEAAGNGAENFDASIYENLFDTTYRNSHAIIIGAGAPPSGIGGTDRSRLGFSNYGQRVNLQGYGLGVVTTGYGGLFSGGLDERQFYTSTFSGTSSAAPIVTGAAAALQGIYKQRYSGAVLDVDRMRDVMIATGSPQQQNPNQHIGPRPDLMAAEAALPPPYALQVSPSYIDTTLDAGMLATISVALSNSSLDETLEYVASAYDTLAKNPGDWLTVTNPTGEISPNSGLTLNVKLDASVIENRSTIYKGRIEISFGPVGGPLDESIVLPVFLNVPCNDSTYSVYASHLGGEITYDWIDITEVGNEIPSYSWYNSVFPDAPIDDGTAGSYFLGFDFPFYDSTYRNIYIGANGGLSFTDDEVNVQGYYGLTPIPNPGFATFIAPFWNDLNFDPEISGHGTVYFYRSPGNDTFIVEYYQVGSFAAPDDTLTTFEVILTPNGDIKCQYLSTGTGGLDASAIIGISESDCFAAPFYQMGQPVENMVSDETAILFDHSIILLEMSGDANDDGGVNVGDAVYLINWIFKGGPYPVNLLEADVNCDGNPNVGDAVYLINYVFKGGEEPCWYELY